MRNPNHSIEVSAAPTAEPVLPADLGAWLGLTVDGSNTALLTALLLSARIVCERHCGLALITQTITQRYDLISAPGRDTWFDGVREMPVTEILCAPTSFRLGRAPVVSITSVKFYGENDDESTADAASYYADVKSRTPTVSLRQGFVWPTLTYRIRDAAQIIYVAGYGADGTAVPQPLKDGIKALAAYVYEHRGTCESEEAIDKSGAKTMWSSYRVIKT